MLILKEDQELKNSFFFLTIRIDKGKIKMVIISSCLENVLKVVN